MKKTNIVQFIFSIIIVISVSYNYDIKYWFKNNRLVKYEHFLKTQPYYNQEHLTKKELKKIPKHRRPKPNAEFEKIKTIDPALGRVPDERLFTALLETERRIIENQSLSFRDSLIWDERGPANVAGRTRAIMFDPNDPDQKRFWAGGVTGGLWFTDDITASSPVWHKIDDLWANLAISSIAYDPTNTNVFYVGTGEIYASVSRGFGIWKSEDGGTSWYHLSGTESFFYVNDLVVRSEGGSGVLYAGVGSNYYGGNWHGNNGLYRSADQGESFVQVLPETQYQPYQPSDLEIGSDNTIWVGTRRNSYGYGQGTILRSDDGSNWSIVYEDLNTKRVELAIAPSDPSVVYAVAESSQGSENDIGFFIRSSNGGGSWTNIAIPLNENGVHFTRGQSWYDLIVTVDPLLSSTIYAGGIDLHKSTDGGSNWSQISQWYGSGYSYVHADQHCIAFRPGHPGEFAVGNDGGIHYSIDSGASFENYIDQNVYYSSKNNGYNVTQFYTLAIHPGENIDQILAGSQDNGTQYFDESGLDYTYEISGGDGAWCFFNESDPAYRITSYIYNNYYLYNNLNYAYTILSDSETGHFINPTDFDSENDVLYATRNDTSLTRVFNVSSAPERNDINGLNLGSFASCLKVSPFDPGYLLVGTDAGRLFEISNANTSSPVANEITWFSFPQGYISSIEYGQSAQQILVTFSNYGVISIWESRDGAQSWMSMEADLPDMPIRWALYHPDNENFIVAATEIGVWTFDANNFQWIPNSDGMANVRVDMLRIRPSDKLLAAATHGRGLFSTTSFGPQSSVDNEFVPEEYRLAQNYPNPFNPSTTISYELPQDGLVSISVIDLAGRHVASLVSGEQRSGIHSIGWNSTNDMGQTVSAGMYYYTIQSGDFTQTRKMILLK